MIATKPLQALWQSWRSTAHKPMYLRRITTQRNLYKNNNQNETIDIKVPLVNSRECQELILSPIKYVEKTPRNNVLCKYVDAFNHWLKLDEEKTGQISDILKLLHGSFFVLDDIYDDSARRNGIPSAHITYGNALSVNAATCAITVAVNKSLSLGHPLAAPTIAEYLREIYKGQSMEIYWRDHLQCPSEEEYKEMLKLKTVSAFLLTINLMQLFSENNSDYWNLSWAFGSYLQILDDYSGLCYDKHAESEVFGMNLTEGKFTLPIIHAINHNEDSPVFHILRQRTSDEGLKRFCVSELERCGSLQYTRDTLAALDAYIRTEMHLHNGNPLLQKLMDDLLTLQ